MAGWLPPRARRTLRRRQVVSERIFADVKVKRDQRVSSTTAQASISTLAASGSAEVAKAVRAGSDEPKKSAPGRRREDGRGRLRTRARADAPQSRQRARR